MCEKSKQAIELYHQARHAEQAGQSMLAESYYIQSQALFVEACEANDTQCLNAANTLNALTFLRWSLKDYEAALYSAKKSVKIMESYRKEFIASADADFLYDTSIGLMDQMQYEVSLVSTKSS